jgi:LmbE family N-acetylglucosaminyl deacetylase
VDAHLVCATRGERGWGGPPEANPGLAAFGRQREGELASAAEALGLRSVTYLDYIDGDLAAAPYAEAVGRLVKAIRRRRPHVVITFPPDGNYGHPDHIAISQLTSAALVCAADAAYVDPAGQPPHRVMKFYYLVDTQSVVDGWHALFGVHIGIEVDGVVRRQVGWEEWAITTRLDAGAHWKTVARAIRCHQSQITSFSFDALPEATLRALWRYGTLYRVYSLVNGGRAIEADVFAGLR